MPTGYTADLTTETTFQEFALRCARAFGATIMMRDDPLDKPIPDEFQPSDYHQKRIVELEAEAAAIKGMTEEQAIQNIEGHNQAQLQRREEVRAKDAATRAAYERMLGLVDEWTPPTQDHRGLKEFMQQQLTESMKFDCHENDVDRWYPTFTGSPKEWIAKRLGEVVKDLGRQMEEHAKELERTRQRNGWVKALRESLREKATA